MLTFFLDNISFNLSTKTNTVNINHTTDKCFRSEHEYIDDKCAMIEHAEARKDNKDNLSFPRDTINIQHGNICLNLMETVLNSLMFLVMEVVFNIVF